MREINALPDENGGGRQGGVVVQISSMGGFVGYPGLAWYNAAKFAVEGFTESVSREVRPEWNSMFDVIFFPNPHPLQPPLGMREGVEESCDQAWEGENIRHS